MVNMKRIATQCTIHQSAGAFQGVSCGSLPLITDEAATTTVIPCGSHSSLTDEVDAESPRQTPRFLKVVEVIIIDHWSQDASADYGDPVNENESESDEEETWMKLGPMFQVSESRRMKRSVTARPEGPSLQGLAPLGRSKLWQRRNVSTNSDSDGKIGQLMSKMHARFSKLAHAAVLTRGTQITAFTAP
jgi:hypothetical protein